MFDYIEEELISTVVYNINIGIQTSEEQLQQIAKLSYNSNDKDFEAKKKQFLDCIRKRTQY